MTNKLDLILITQLRFNDKIWCSAHSADPDSRKFAFMPRNVQRIRNCVKDANDKDEEKDVDENKR